jgi:hypothetical protein
MCNPDYGKQRSLIWLSNVPALLYPGGLERIVDWKIGRFYDLWFGLVIVCGVMMGRMPEIESE